MPVRKRTLRTVLATSLVGLVALLSGCVTVPTTGPVERVNGAPPACQNCVSVEVAPPAVGDDQRQIVEGYLRAVSNYQSAASVARQFMTKAAAEKWSPGSGVLIYRGKAPTVDGDVVTLVGTVVGTLGADRTYNATDQGLDQKFELVKENGEWRVSNPYPGLLVSESLFPSFYQPATLYFLSKPDGASLVPQSIFVPSVRNQANLASALIKALLEGPSGWLKPAVSTAVPVKTALTVDSVTVTDGIAEVPLSDTVLTLSDAAREQLAAQIAYTLKPLSVVKGVVITVDGSRFRVPQGDPNTMVFSAAGIPPSMDPVPPVAGSQLYSVTQGANKVQSTAANLDETTTQPLDTPLGAGRYRVDSLAVSVSNTDVAAVTDDQTRLLRGSVKEKSVTALVKRSNKVTKLLRPQFSRYGEIWAVGEQNGRQRIWYNPGAEDDVDVRVAASVIRGGRITAFKISPDGTRMALIRTTATGSELGLARIIRSDQVTVDGWHPLNTQQKDATVTLKRMVDVAWLDATNLLVLGAESAQAAIAPYQLSDDAFELSRAGEAANWDATEISVELSTQVAVIRGSTGQTWRDDGSQWLAFGNEKKLVSAIAYPG